MLVAVIVGTLLIGGGVAAAATGHLPALPFLPKAVSRTIMPAVSPAAGSHTPNPTGSPSAYPSAAATSGHTAGPGVAVINGHSYGNPPGAYLEPGAMVAWSAEPLELSTTHITFPAGQSSPRFSATSPDGYALCPAGAFPGPLSVAWPNGIICSPTITLEIVGGATPGTYTVHAFAETKDKVWNGKYLGYEGYITVVVTQSTGYSLSVGTPHYDMFQYGGVSGFEIPVTIVRGGAYTGSPTVTPLPPYSLSGICMSQDFVKTSPDSYLWSCKLNSYGGSPSWTMSFLANDGVTQKEAGVNLSY